MVLHETTNDLRDINNQKLQKKGNAQMSKNDMTTKAQKTARSTGIQY